MGTISDICILVKYSPKQEKMLSKITNNIEEKFDKETTNQQASKLNKLCVTRWTVRAECFKKIKENYQALLQLMRDSLEEKLDFDTNL